VRFGLAAAYFIIGGKFMKINQILEFNSGELNIIGSRPGLGKTFFALQMAVHKAFDKNEPVAFLSFEMGKEALLKRLFKISGIKTEKVYDSQFFIFDPVNINFSELELCIKNLYNEKNIKVFFIDYLGLISSDNPDSPRLIEMNTILLKLKTLAKELDISIIAISHLKRENEYSLDKPPTAIINPNFPPIYSFRDISDNEEILSCIDRVFLIYKNVELKTIINIFTRFNNDWKKEEMEWKLPV